MKSQTPILILGLLMLALPGCRREEAPPAGSPAASRPSALLANFDGHDPVLRWDGTGNLHVLYIKDSAAGGAVFYRRLGAHPAGPIAVSPAGTVTATDPETPPTLDLLPGGELVTAYPVQLPGKWKSDLRMQLSTDGGATWSEPVRLHPPQLVAHSFVSSALTSAGTLAFAWLDSRDGKMGLRAASTRDGRTLSADQTLDPVTCQCCGTAMLAGRQGELWLGYRDLEADNLRDFRILKSAAEPPVFASGVKLSSDGWKINGCPESGVRLAQTADGALWAAWFTAGGQPGVYVTSSRDGGASFAPRMLLSEPERPGMHPEIGVLPGGRVAVLYEGADTDGTRVLRVRVRDANGSWGAARRIGSRGDHLRLATNSDRSAVAVTCRGGQGPRVLIADGSSLDSSTEEGLSCGSGGNS